MSFRYKTVIGIAMIEAVMLALIVWNAIYILTLSNERELIKRVNTTTELFAASNKEAVLSTDLATLESFVTEVLKKPGIVYARILGRNKVILAEGGNKIALLRPFYPDINYVDIKDGIFDAQSFIKVADVIYGSVEIGFSIDEIEAVISVAQRKSVVFAIGAILLSAIFSFILGTYLTRAINDLRKGAKNISAGNLGYQIKVQGNDELAAAAASFNDMSEKLSELDNERVKTEEALKESEGRYRNITENSSFGISAYNESGQCVIANQTLAAIVGATVEQLLSQNIHTIQSWRKSGMLEAANEALESGEKRTKTIHVVSTFGKDVWLDCTFVPYHEKSDKFLLFLAEEVTARIQSESALRNAKAEIEAWNKELEIRVKEKTEELVESKAQLIQAEKLSAMGQMAGGLAHELNSPLAGLLPMIEQYKNEAEKDSNTYTELSLMLKACEHMAKIVRDFGSFSRESKGELNELNIKDIIEDTLSFSASRFKQKGIQIIKEYKNTLPKVKGNKTELQQVVLNMIANALDAMTVGGKLTIRTDITKDNVIMEFTDNGAGIEKEYLSKVFDPFYTTKRPGKGTGLGLAISYKIIEKHGGNISAESEPGKETKFTIYLPAVKTSRI